jgi:ATP-dependent RNA helicase SUPV3L1/SUV3
LLEPLVKLAEDEDLTGLARGLAFRLVESLGVLPRDEVAEDVKSLSQEERAGLRKYGVRFGAFHIFVPPLLKPAPTTLRLLLWALSLERQGRFDRTAIPQPPGQGLTSVSFDRTTPRGFYRVVGFRLCGPRAVRIDMLERLADLIRERVFWRPRFEGEARPQGSVEGGGFAIVPDMMSLVGCSGEEFAAILRALGFRMLRRPAPKREVEAAPLAETAPSPEAASAVAPQETSAESPPAEAIAQAQPAEASPPAPEAVASSPAEPATADSDRPAPPAEDLIEVWWPKDTGPFRQHQHQKSRRKPGPSRKAKRPDQQAPAKPPRPPHPPARKPQAPQKPAVNPDSPFAVLGMLRSQLAEKKNA